MIIERLKKQVAWTLTMIRIKKKKQQQQQKNRQEK